MKYLTIVIFIILTFDLKSQTKINKQLLIDFDLIATSRCNDNNDFYAERNNRTYSNLIGQIIIKNQTDSIFTFWIMTCSWTDLFKIDPDSIKLNVNECDKNHPTKISLQKGQSIIFNSIIEIPFEYFQKSLDKIYDSYQNSDSRISYNTFRIGFLLIREIDYKKGPDWREILNDTRKNDNYIWSEPINIRYSNYGWRIKQ